MFGKASYFLYTLIFTLPLISALWIYYFPSLKRNFGIPFLATFLLTLYGFFLWPLGLKWQTWAYSSEKILGVQILGTYLEDILWWLLICFLLSSFATIFAEKEEEQKPVLKRG